MLLLQVVIISTNSDTDEIISHVHVRWRVMVFKVVEVSLVGLEVLVAKIPAIQNI
jgi:hypothetical protein